MRRSARGATAPADGGRRRGERLAAQRLAHQIHGTCCAHQSAPLGAIGRQDGLQPVPRKFGAQLCPDHPVAFARPLNAGGQVMPGQLRERHRVPPQHAVDPVVRWHHVQQPGHRGLLEPLAAWRMDPHRPAGRNVMCHDISIEGVEHTFHLIMTDLHVALSRGYEHDSLRDTRGGLAAARPAARPWRRSRPGWDHEWGALCPR